MAYEGTPDNVPAQVDALRVLHRKGQTFIVFRETDERSAEASPDDQDVASLPNASRRPICTRPSGWAT